MAINTATGVYWDVSSRPTNVQNVELTGDPAFANSILNIFATPYNDRSATFCPGFGSRMRELLQEPINAVTARHIYSYALDAISMGHPLAQVDVGATSVEPLSDGTGYRLVLVVSQKHNLAKQSISFDYVR